MFPRIAVVAIACLAVGTIHSQATDGPAPTFEVASVKPAKPRPRGQPNPSRGLLPGRYEMLGYTLGQFVGFAYQKQPDEIAAPSWLDADRFDIVATMPAETTRDQAMRMLQALLEQRFQLKLHREQRLVEVYSLEIAKDGPKMEATEWHDGNGRSINAGPVIQARKSSMDALAAILSRWMDHKVVDRTGLTTLYNFTLKWHPEGPAGTVSSGSEVFEALQEQLGLKMVARKLPVEFVVVDHAERIPSGN
jgi:uncharacterized protein (TIGR03435 family)